MKDFIIGALSTVALIAFLAPEVINPPSQLANPVNKVSPIQHLINRLK